MAGAKTKTLSRAQVIAFFTSNSFIEHFSRFLQVRAQTDTIASIPDHLISSSSRHPYSRIIPCSRYGALGKQQPQQATAKAHA